MSNSTDERLRRIERRLDELERRMDRAAVGGDGSDDRVVEVSRALNGLRRQHRDLRDTVENTVLDYLAEERSVLQQLQRRVQEYGELMREIKRNREQIGAVHDRLDGTVDADRFAMEVDELRTMHHELKERVKKLESRLDFLTAD